MRKRFLKNNSLEFILIDFFALNINRRKKNKEDFLFNDKNNYFLEKIYII